MIKTKTLSVENKVRGKFSRYCTLALSAVIGVIGFSGIQAFAQTAVLENGTILTRLGPDRVFATEGPITDINISERTITVTGKILTFPLTIDGVVLEMSGSSALGQDGEAETGISAANFDRLLDINATVRDVNMGDITAATRDITKDRRGAARSIFGSDEAGRDILTDPTAPASRDPVALANMKALYFDYVQKAYAQHIDYLPANFLDLAGIRAGGNVYPDYAGATLKSAGHVYVDVLGNEYFVTDIETVLELSENVASGVVRHIDPGNKLTGLPASMVIGDLLMIFNQDPRFGSDIFGVLESPIPFDIFLAEGTGKTVDTIGHQVGGHVLFIQELITELFDSSLGVLVHVERWEFDDEANELRFRGSVSEANLGTADELLLTVTISEGGTSGKTRSYAVEILPAEEDIVIGIGAGTESGGVFGFRVRDKIQELNISIVESITVKMNYKFDSAEGTPFHAAGELAFSETFLRVDVFEPLN